MLRGPMRPPVPSADARAAGVRPAAPPELPAGAPLAPEVRARLEAFVALLGVWTQRINLVSAADRGAVWPRHVADSLRLVPLMPAGVARAIDLGSGAGFPGLVLAVATGVAFVLVESDRRKATFLGEAIRVTGAPASVHCGRIEGCGLPPAGLVTARALAPLGALLGLAAPLLSEGGVMLLPKGVRAEAEVAEAERDWCFGLERRGDPPVLVVRAPRRRA